VVSEGGPDAVTALRLLVAPSSAQAIAAAVPACCTCDPFFFPTACDVDCPYHGLEATLRDFADEVLAWWQ
jgi:hypothetical protein